MSKLHDIIFPNLVQAEHFLLVKTDMITKNHNIPKSQHQIECMMAQIAKLPSPNTNQHQNFSKVNQFIMIIGLI